jgi:hypothetical protein
MTERRQPEFDPEAAVRTIAGDLPDIETPVIDIQDLEHQPGSDTRVNNKGVKVEARSAEQRAADGAMFAREDRDAREAIAEFERLLKSLPPD